ncbi:MAG: FHA domain-containing protein [Chloroflexi bacterium]|nr:FHA domain-containing protein [Chloroflexota bacterium]
MNYIQDILNEYTQMRDNGAESKSALQALRPHIEKLNKKQREELAALIRTWENQNPAEKTKPRPHPVIKPLAAKPAADTPPPAPAAVAPQPENAITWVACPNCGKTNQSHEVFCYACGHLLDTRRGEQNTKHFADAGDTMDSGYFGDDSVLALRARGSSETYEVRPQKADHEIIVGRSSSGSAIAPDVDLKDRQAADLGVSRMHLALRYDADQKAVLASDLGSANGTFINGQRVLPKEVRALHHGDELRLGRLILIVSFRHPGEQI